MFCKGLSVDTCFSGVLSGWCTRCPPKCSTDHLPICSSSARVAGNPVASYNEAELFRVGLAEEQPRTKHDRRTLTGEPC